MKGDIEAYKKFVNSGNESLLPRPKLLKYYILSLILFGGICFVFYYFLANQLLIFILCLVGSFFVVMMIVYFLRINEMLQKILLNGIWGLFVSAVLLLLGLLFLYDIYKSPAVTLLMGIIIAIVVIFLTLIWLRNIFKGKYADTKHNNSGYAYSIIGGALGSLLGVTILPRIFDASSVSGSAMLLLMTIIFLAVATFMFSIIIVVISKIYYAWKYGIESIATDIKAGRTS